MKTILQKHIRHFAKGLAKSLAVAICLFAPRVALSATDFYQNQMERSNSVPTPEVWQFMRYGGQSIDYFKGTASVNIPIYTYKDQDFELPISIGYGSSGFMPNEQTGTLGIGWFLNATGYVTREVRGCPDEGFLLNTPDGSVCGYYGFYSSNYNPSWHDIIQAHEVGWTDGMSNAGVPLKHHSLKFYLCGESGKYPTSVYESEPDLFHFNFFGHSGSFMLGPLHKVYVFDTGTPSGEYNVKVERLDMYPGITTRLKITIKTGDGNTYIFSNAKYWDLDFCESILEPEEDEDFPRRDYSNIFPLTEIDAPNGRSVTFGYSDIKQIDLRKPSASINEAGDIPEYYYTPTPRFTAANQLMLTGDYSGKGQGTQNVINLMNIDVDHKVQITFAYKDKTKEIARYHPVSESGYCERLRNAGILDSIVIKDNSSGRTLKTAKFTYDTATLGNPITFLRSADVSGEGRYLMYYYQHDGPFPFQYETGMDHWGYYNLENRFGCRYLINPNRTPDFNLAVRGMLKTLKYPTGGHTVYEYENNRYNRGSGADTLVGGVRICKITDYTKDDDPSPSVRKFVYGPGVLCAERPQLISEGIITLTKESDCTAYNTFPIAAPTNSEEGYLRRVRFIVPVYSGFSKNGMDVCYPYVTEINNDGSYAKYKFTCREISDMCDGCHYTKFYDWQENGGMTHEGEPICARNGIFPIRDESYYPLTGGLPAQVPDDYSIYRGKILIKEIFDKDGNRLQKESYDYAFLHDDIEYILGYGDCDNNDNHVNSVKEGVDCYYMQEKAVKDLPAKSMTKVNYFNSGRDSVMTTTAYEYNQERQLIKESTVDSRGNYIITKTYYPGDVKLNAALQDYSDMATSMVNANVVSPPLLVVKSVDVDPNVNVNVIAASRYKYGGSLQKLIEIDNTVFTAPTNITNGIPGEADFKKEISYQYNNTGNVVQVIDRNNIRTVLIWGYGGLCLVAKVENVSDAVLNQISTVLGLNIATATLAGVLTDSQCTQLRGLSGVRVTTYTHIPYVGVASITDPSGRTARYDYDSDGRVTAIWDDHNQLVKSYQYNIKHPQP